MTVFIEPPEACRQAALRLYDMENAQRQEHLLDGLQSLLQRQVELAHQGNIAGVEMLSEQSNSLVAAVTQSGIADLPEFKSRREHLKQLYSTLRLALTANRAETAERLSNIRKAQKTVSTYRKNIRL